MSDLMAAPGELKLCTVCDRTRQAEFPGCRREECPFREVEEDD